MAKATDLGRLISLPKGGGALRGIGEKFAPDLHTGTANMTVPLAVLPGRNGFEPTLSLSYSSGNGNGAFGLGWRLDTPRVTRKTSSGVPTYSDSDVFILSGSEDLVPEGAPSGESVRYRPRTEEGFARITRRRETGSGGYWVVETRDGLRSLYGTPRPQGAPAGWRDPAAVADPSNPGRVAAWLLTLTTDPFGNRIEYEYSRFPSSDPAHRDSDQLYLSAVKYLDYAQSGHSGFLAEVVLSYGPRPDPFSEYRFGFEVRTEKRCRQVAVYSLAGARQLAFSHELGYLDEAGGAALPPNGVSHLARVQTVGHDGGSRQENAPLRFTYSAFRPDRRRLLSATGPDQPPHSLDHPNYVLADIAGNGLPGVLELDGGARYWRNLGGGRFDRPKQLAEAPTFVRLEEEGVQVLDANGDGRPDLLLSTSETAGYFSAAPDGEGGGTWDRRSFRPFAAAPTFDLEGPDVRLLDLTGDGVTDVIRDGTRFAIYFGDKQEGWKGPHLVERRPRPSFPDVNFADARVKLADMTGDGLQDIVYVHERSVEYWPALGHGRWGQAVRMASPPGLPSRYDPERLLFGDIDGDGAADLVYVGESKVTVWVNRTGAGWSDPLEVPGTPSPAGASVRLADLLGTGVSGVLWSTGVNGQARASMFFLDLAGGAKPYLLAGVDNGLGAVTRIEYAPSTKYYLEDDRRPETRWMTSLPFPVQVVARVEVEDVFSSNVLTTEYSYHHGHWDGEEREFRGFGRVDQRDARTIPGGPPPTETRTWFHLGPVAGPGGGWRELDYSKEFWHGDAQIFSTPKPLADWSKSLDSRTRRDLLRCLRGRVLRAETYARDGTPLAERPYSVAEHLHAVRWVRPDLPQPPSRPEPWQTRVFFPHKLAERTTQYDRGTDPLTTLAYTEDYDGYGMGRTSISVAVPRRRNYLEPGPAGDPFLASVTRTRFAQRDDAGRYIVDRAADKAEYECVNDGSPSLADLLARIRAGTGLRLFEHALTFYDGAGFVGLPSGQVGDYGAAVRTERLMLTEPLLHEAYKSGSAPANPPEVPPYLHPTNPVWTAEYPAGFRAIMATRAGVHFERGGADGYVPGYYTAERRQLDFQNGETPRGRLRVSRDAFGRDTRVDYDAQFGVFPAVVIEPGGVLKTEAQFDMRVFQPAHVVDENGNVTRYGYSPLGMPATVTRAGRPGHPGDTVPSERYEYDLTAYVSRGKPASVYTTRRCYFGGDTSVPADEINRVIRLVEFTDGFGRALQARAEAADVRAGDRVTGNLTLPEPGQPAGNVTLEGRAAGTPAWVTVSGHKRYDDKGRVVEEYEPYFSSGWAYAEPTGAERHGKTTFKYDPLGRLSLSLAADGAERLTVYGSLADPSRPDLFAPTPWEVHFFDENDNAGRTHPDASAAYAAHWNTPRSETFDALGRTLITIERGESPAPATVTRASYDIRGNVLSVRDAQGREAARHVYDLFNRAMRIEGVDSGVRRAVYDAEGNLVEHREATGSCLLQTFTTRGRRERAWARDRTAEKVTLREVIVYGDAPESGLSADAARDRNLLGRVYQHYDEAGLLAVESYDLAGNPESKARGVFKDSVVLAGFTPRPPGWVVPAFRADWQPPAGTGLPALAARLLGTSYATSYRFDAIGRLRELNCPHRGRAAKIEVRYDAGGAPERVLLDGTAYVSRSVYNARGQRVIVVYGNGVVSRYDYDPNRRRLRRSRSEHCAVTGPLTYRPDQPALVSEGLKHDLIGNVLAIIDRSPGCGVPATPNSLDRTFAYDARYRLTRATGRECDAAPPLPWDQQVRCVDVRRTRPYERTYEYDQHSNLLRLRHAAGATAYNRSFDIDPARNRMRALRVGAATYAYAHDAAGNVVDETTSRHFEWDHQNRLRVYRTQTAGAEPSKHAHYLYDAGGRRVMTVVRNQGGGTVRVTVDIDGVAEHVREGRRERWTVRVMERGFVTATVRAGDALGDALAATKYFLSDHLGSARAVVDTTGALLVREDFFPYGEVSFGGAPEKRVGFAGKERDDGSNLYYFGARYYAPWLARWMSCDPEGLRDGPSPYIYSRSNPVRFIDPSGRAAEESDRPATGQSAAAGGAALTGVSSAVDPKADAITRDPLSETAAGTTGASLGGAVNRLGQVRAEYTAGAKATSAIHVKAIMSGNFPGMEYELARGASEMRDTAKAIAREKTPALVRAVLEVRDALGKRPAPGAAFDKHITAGKSAVEIAQKAGQTSKFWNAMGAAARASGPGLQAFGAALSGVKMYEGFEKIARGQLALGALDVGEGATNVLLSAGIAAGVAAGSLAATPAIAAGVLGGLAIAGVANLGRSMLEGRQTPATPFRR
jgi:RHS repeat-associated protein